MTEYTEYGRRVRMDYFDKLPPRLRQAMANHPDSMDCKFAFDKLQEGRTEDQLITTLDHLAKFERIRNEQLYLGLARADQLRRARIDLARRRGLPMLGRV